MTRNDTKEWFNRQLMAYDESEVTFSNCLPHVLVSHHESAGCSVQVGGARRVAGAESDLQINEW